MPSLPNPKRFNARSLKASIVENRRLRDEASANADRCDRAGNHSGCEGYSEDYHMYQERIDELEEQLETLRQAVDLLEPRDYNDADGVQTMRDFS